MKAVNHNLLSFVKNGMYWLNLHKLTYIIVEAKLHCHFDVTRGVMVPMHCFNFFTNIGKAQDIIDFKWHSRSTMLSIYDIHL
ncbi:hypothetical protein RIF29_37837 [Crotalaria pallida]|uniref:Uncharacterized protein n=1 Tax=Crotalaria pallida TaxID=3830 RepID=A0AAN9E144_CROPI